MCFTGASKRARNNFTTLWDHHTGLFRKLIDYIIIIIISYAMLDSRHQ